MENEQKLVPGTPPPTQNCEAYYTPHPALHDRKLRDAESNDGIAPSTLELDVRTIATPETAHPQSDTPCELEVSLNRFHNIIEVAVDCKSPGEEMKRLPQWALGPNVNLKSPPPASPTSASSSDNLEDSEESSVDASAAYELTESIDIIMEHVYQSIDGKLPSYKLLGFDLPQLFSGEEASQRIIDRFKEKLAKETDAEKQSILEATAQSLQGLSDAHARTKDIVLFLDEQDRQLKIAERQINRLKKQLVDTEHSYQHDAGILREHHAAQMTRMEQENKGLASKNLMLEDQVFSLTAHVDKPLSTLSIMQQAQGPGHQEPTTYQGMEEAIQNAVENERAETNTPTEPDAVDIRAAVEDIAEVAEAEGNPSIAAAYRDTADSMHRQGLDRAHKFGKIRTPQGMKTLLKMVQQYTVFKDRPTLAMDFTTAIYDHIIKNSTEETYYVLTKINNRGLPNEATGKVFKMDSCVELDSKMNETATSINVVHNDGITAAIGFQDQNIPGLCTFPIKKMDINDPKAKISIKRLKKDEPRNGRQGAKHTYYMVVFGESLKCHAITEPAKLSEATIQLVT